MEEEGGAMEEEEEDEYGEEEGLAEEARCENSAIGMGGVEGGVCVLWLAVCVLVCVSCVMQECAVLCA
eukprot:662311-Rhodomonas_salina.1